MPKETSEYYINCECGKVISYRNMKKHIKTMKHQGYKQNQENNEFLSFINNCVSV